MIETYKESLTQLSVYTKEAFINEMKRYEKDYINQDTKNIEIIKTIFFLFEYVDINTLILSWYDRELEEYDIDKQIHLYWIDSNEEKTGDLWFVTFEVNEEIMFKYITKQISPREIMLFDTTKTFIAIRNFDNYNQIVIDYDLSKDWYKNQKFFDALPTEDAIL